MPPSRVVVEGGNVVGPQGKPREEPRRYGRGARMVHAREPDETSDERWSSGGGRPPCGGGSRGEAGSARGVEARGEVTPCGGDARGSGTGCVAAHG